MPGMKQKLEKRENYKLSVEEGSGVLQTPIIIYAEKENVSIFVREEGSQRCYCIFFLFPFGQCGV